MYIDKREFRAVGVMLRHDQRGHGIVSFKIHSGVRLLRTGGIKQAGKDAGNEYVFHK
jgi:hypothetical protein